MSAEGIPPGSAASAEDTPDYPICPAIPPLVALALIIILALVAPVDFLPQAASLAAGIPLFALGLGTWVWGVVSLKRGDESPDPRTTTDRLITSGAFRLSRNPIYLGGTTGLLGLALLLDTLTGVAVAAALGITAHVMILNEEPYLDAKFGEEWRSYASRVRRWI